MADRADRDQRTEEPSARRLQEARERGQVPRSRELAGTAVLLAGAATLWVAGDAVGRDLAGLVRGALRLQRAALLDAGLMPDALAAATIVCASSWPPKTTSPPRGRLRAVNPLGPRSSRFNTSRNAARSTIGTRM